MADSVPPTIRDHVAVAVPHEYWGRDPAVPEREEVYAAVLPGAPETDHGSFTCYGDDAPLYRATCGIEAGVDVPDDYTDDDFMREFEGRTGCRTERIPASGRYYWLPILPHPLTELPGTP